MDNKYANLPGIAHNQPDYYETPNVVTSQNDRQEQIENEESSNIEKISLNSGEAKEKFKNKSLNSDFVDFSDRITNRRKFGYTVEPDTFEWNQDITETPLQRFQRIERELNDLKRDLKDISNNSNQEEKNLLNFDPVSLSKQVETLQKQINSLHLDSIGAKQDDSIDKNAKKKMLIDTLIEYKKSLAVQDKSDKTKKENTSGSAETGITFKLFTDLDHEELKKANKVAELNQRLSNIEKVFGAGNGSIGERQINTLCVNIENKSILGLIENLNTKLNLLDSQNLTQVEARLQAVTDRVNQLNEKKQVIEDAEKLNRINEIYSMITKWKDVSSTVPAIVERLTALNHIHQKAFEFTSMLTSLDKEQNTIQQTLEASSEALDKLKKNFETNLDSIKSNFDILNEKISAVATKTS